MEHTPTKTRDVVSLMKPGITLMSVLMAAAGIGLAPGGISMVRGTLALFGIGLIVACAHVFNMYMERDSDRLMERTRRRPLADGRMDPRSALILGAALTLIGLAALAVVHPLVAYIGALAIVLYVLVYTPMKRISPLALLVGAIPGAFPPLLGWVAVTGRIDPPAVVLFGIMWIWQVPHFVAITLYRGGDYANAGIRTTSVVHGDIVAKLEALAYTTLLIPISLVLVPMGVAGQTYFAIGLVAGLAFVVMAARGFLPGAGDRWARGLFRFSLLYLPALTLALMLDIALA
ncbi:MAG: heme o synthase [Alphaproteobacteria bacterium]|uniref:Protoheme IX farnesyltransferase n=1 Tax=Candidatus Nitrobium versatile TaxID=2884831 RepID=A0A953JAW7_9BACT|nr:heme o synthase [Candidatus Nitrobium versatile]